MKLDTLSVVIIGFIILFSGITAFIYSVNYTNTQSSGTPSPNTVAINRFLTANGLNNNTNISAIYAPGNMNYMVINCNFGFMPSILYIPAEFRLQNETAFSMYNNIVKYGALYTLCSVYPTAGFCIDIKQRLFNMTVNVVNYSEINTAFNAYESALNTIYNNLSSIILNSSAFTPLVTDVRLLRSTNNSLDSMLNTLISLQQMPDTIIVYPNGTRHDAGFSLPVPFQYPLTHFLGINSCNSSLNVFNLITNVVDFNTVTYSNILSNVSAKITNVCVRTATNQCNETAMREFNMSFYV